MSKLRLLSRVTGLLLALACAACTTTDGRAPPTSAGPGSTGRAAITVGSFDFPESVLLAYLYADALAARGYPVRVLPDLGPRELVDPALMSGLIQLVPEYSGSALQFVSIGRMHPTANVAATEAALSKAMAARGIVTADAAAAQDANAVVVTAATAARYHLHSTSDLAKVAPRLVFGGPPECPERPYCLPGLRRAYGLRFRTFIALDAGGALTRQALESGDIGAALLFTTDPDIETRHLVILSDDRGLQPAENIVPVLRSETAARFGPGLLSALNAVSARLSTAALADLVARVEVRGLAAKTVADDWLSNQGLLLTAQEAQ